ncbi:MAG: beta-ketoacyl-[acyl-carrier-protein] synthase family protein [Planctomycetota bacterium]
MTRRRVALTGIGLLTAYGVGEEPFWNGLIEGRTAVREVEAFREHGFPTTHYGLLPEVDYDAYLDPQKSAFWSVASKAAVTAGELAARSAGLEASALAGPRTGVLLGTGYGCLYEMEDLYRTWLNKGWKRIKPVTVPKLMPNAPASHLAIHYGARGINATISTACSSGAIALGLAAERIRSGDLDACVTGGVDVIGNDAIVAAWNALRVLSRNNTPEASRPFDGQRDGLVFGEGGAIFLLEDWDTAVARGAPIRAEIAGVAATNDAVNIVGPDVTGETEAIEHALADAGIEPGQLDYVCAHGTSTEANDLNETEVLKQMLGDRARAIPVSSIKGHIGHSMGAAGAIEIAATTLILENQRVPATLHLENPDPQCDLDYVTDGPRDVSMEYAMTNSFGFGGQNSVIVLRTAGG